MSYETITVEVADRLAVITVDRPEARLRAGHGLRHPHRRRHRALRPPGAQPLGAPGGGRDPASGPADRNRAGDRADPHRPVLDADEARQAGLVTSVVPTTALLDEARTVADRILAKGPLAVRLAKLVVRTGGDTDQRTGRVVERLAQSLLYTTDDKREGAAAFLEKRTPEFRGR